MKTKCCIFPSPGGTSVDCVVVEEGLDDEPGCEVIVGGGEEGLIIVAHAETCRLMARIITSATTLLILRFAITLLL